MKKRIPFTTDKQLEGIGWTSRVMNFGVALTIASAFNELYTAHMMLRERPDLYKKEIKRHANDAIRFAEMKKGQMLNYMEHRKFYDTYADKVIDLTENDITIFRISIKQTLDEARYKDAELVSYIETARALLNAATIQFREVIRTTEEDYGKYTCELILPKVYNPKHIQKFTWDYNFSEFNVANVLKSWDTVCDLLYGNDSDIDLNTERSTTLFDILCKKFAEGDYVQPCLKEAHEAFPEFIKNEIIVKQ